MVPSYAAASMADMKSIQSIGMYATVLCLAVACGSASGAATASQSSPPSSGSTHHAVVDVQSSKYGQILFDGQGRALYLFAADKTSTPTCYDSCASVWPPYLTEKGDAVNAMHAATGSLTGTTPRTDGTLQVTYNGHPLYYYSGDKNPGDVLCQGVVDHGGAWYVVDPQGNAITKT
jgi:predicted lipoprotein with Yx(FWY)xxD motif